jgi:hypothetical protein
LNIDKEEESYKVFCVEIDGKAWFLNTLFACNGGIVELYFPRLA